MNILQSLLLSIVEGLTEFLPISSTGHLILVSNLFKIEQSEFVKSFEIIIQLGAILAVVFIYFKSLIYNFNLWKKIIIAFLPSTIFGLLFYKYIKMYLIGNHWVVIASLFVGGLVMLLFEKYFKAKDNIKIDNLSTKRLLIIGLMQVVSMIPGVSRAFATIFSGMLVGLNRKDATQFSFFLAIPTMAAAVFLDLLKTDISIWNNQNINILAVGFIGSFVTAYVVIRWLIKYVSNNNFSIFAWYRITIALFLFYLL